jgi:hypothetical protein
VESKNQGVGATVILAGVVAIATLGMAGILLSSGDKSQQVLGYIALVLAPTVAALVAVIRGESNARKLDSVEQTAASVARASTAALTTVHESLNGGLSDRITDAVGTALAARRAGDALGDGLVVDPDRVVAMKPDGDG